MVKTIRYFEARWKLSPGALSLALAIGTSALVAPAFAQQEVGNRPQRERADGAAAVVRSPAEIDEQAKAILAKSAERYKNLKSLHVEQEVVNAGRFTKKVTAEYRKPQDLVVTTNEAKGIKTVAYYDAANVTTLRDFDSVVEYQVTSQARAGEAPAGGPGNVQPNFGNALGQYLSGFVSGAENVFGNQNVQTVKYAGEASLNGVPVDNVTVTSQRRNQPVTAVYSIGKQDSLLHKVVQSTLNADGTSTEYVETYSNKVDVPLADSLFKFAPPAGATKVDRFTRSRGVQARAGDTPFAIKTKDLDGKDLALEQYKGKVVLLDFWATWCAPCRAELPNLKAAYAKYKDLGFDVVGISLDQTTAPLKPFVKKEALDWRHVYDGYWNGPIASAYNVRFIPTTILIGRDGKIAAVNPRGSELEPAIQAALLGP